MGNNGQINPPDPNRRFTLKTCELAVVNKNAWQLWYDFQIVASMARELPTETPRGWEGKYIQMCLSISCIIALRVANEMINVFRLEDEETWKQSSRLAKEFMKSTAGEATHKITAVANCHIDTAWLWNYAETRRKCARSFSSQLRLMDRYPDFTFACSQAQQLEWVKEIYPSLFAEIKQKAVEGKFIPVGGTWVEMDANIPSGEAFVRQFLFGQRFFESNFGKRCEIFWLPGILTLF